MFSPVEQIKDRLDIIEVIQGYIQLNKIGANYKACCPFHNEKTPSFTVSAEKQIWHCFGCGLGGDIFGFVMQIEGVEFKDALRILAERAGIKLEKQDPKLISQKERIESALKEAEMFFQNQLANTPEGKMALKYLIEERGISQESIQKFSLGYAPNQWQTLSTKAGLPADLSAGASAKAEALVQAGLAYKKDGTNEVIDRFRGRIMFPIKNGQGRTVGFGGRIFEPVHHDKEKLKQVGKYINTPQTLLYNKSQILYGLDQAKNAIRRSGECILVEGNLDVIASHQAGVENTVATSGTALTEDQIKTIKRLTEKIVLAFDMDQAGIDAMQKSVDITLKNGFNISIVVNDSGKDAAEIAKTDPEEWKNAVKNAVGVMDFYFNVVFKDLNLEGSANKRIVASKVLPIILKMSDSIMQADALRRLAEKLNINERILRESLMTNRQAPITGQSQVTVKQKSKRTLLEEKVLSLLIGGHCHNLDIFLRLDFSPDDFLDDELKKVAKCAWDLLRRDSAINFKKFREELQDSVDSNTVDCLLLMTEEKEDDPIREIENSIMVMQKMSLRTILENLSNDIKEAERNNDKKALKIFLEEFEKYSKKIIDIGEEK
ncbi:DNA primase [bacterium]|nr:MAG: DNA primase [bacterium]